MTHRPLADIRQKAILFQRAAAVSQVTLMVGALALMDRLKEPALDAPDALGILFPVLAAIALLDLGFAWALPRILMGAQRLRGVMLAADPHAPQEPGQRGGDEAGIHPLRAGLQAALGSHLVRLALIESVAIYGIALSVLSADSRYCLALGAIALAATLGSRFDTSAVEEVYRRLELEDAWRPDR